MWYYWYCKQKNNTKISWFLRIFKKNFFNNCFKEGDGRGFILHYLFFFFFFLINYRNICVYISKNHDLKKKKCIHFKNCKKQKKCYYMMFLKKYSIHFDRICMCLTLNSFDLDPFGRRALPVYVARLLVDSFCDFCGVPTAVGLDSFSCFCVTCLLIMN
jgi:hypothetical protein